MIYILFITEGPHDVAAIGRILKEHKFNLLNKKNDVAPLAQKLIPKAYPLQDDDILKRYPVPTFYQKDDYSVIIISAEGDSKINKSLDITLISVDINEFSGIAVICDNDKDLPLKRFEKLKKELNAKGILNSITKPGEVIGKTQKTGIFILPDNESQGTLEDILIKCSEKRTPDLHKKTEGFIKDVKECHPVSWTGSDEKKAFIGCISNIHKPGRANQVSIQDGKWICKETLKIKSVSDLEKFVIKIIGI